LTKHTICGILPLRRIADNGRRSNLPPAKEVSKMEISDVIALLILITDVVALVANICNKKR
jgi:hypothetical protein